MKKSVKINANWQFKRVDEIEENKMENTVDGYFPPRKLIIAKNIGKHFIA